MVAIITLRMSKGFFRPGLVSSDKISPMRVKLSSPLRAVRISANVAVDGVGRGGLSWKSLARKYVRCGRSAAGECGRPRRYRVPNTGPDH